MNFTIGWADLEHVFVVKKFDELLKILDEINLEFSGGIKKTIIFHNRKII